MLKKTIFATTLSLIMLSTSAHAENSISFIASIESGESDSLPNMTIDLDGTTVELSFGELKSSKTNQGIQLEVGVTDSISIVALTRNSNISGSVSTGPTRIPGDPFTTETHTSISNRITENAIGLKYKFNNNFYVAYSYGMMGVDMSYNMGFKISVDGVKNPIEVENSFSDSFNENGHIVSLGMINQLSDKFSLNSRVDYRAYKSFDVTTLSIHTEYGISDNVSLGLGYTTSKSAGSNNRSESIDIGIKYSF